jgi:hypothetical protein
VEQRLVANVHAQGHLGLLAVATERTLAYQQTYYDPAIEIR